MTKAEKARKKNAFPRLGKALPSCLLLLLIFFLAESEQLNLWMQDSLTLCAKVLIPSLFPFLILSDLILTSGAADRLGLLVGKPVRRLLGISPQSVSAVLLGMLCGFPIGAKMAISLYEEGRIGKSEAERLLALCSIPSPAFLIGSVGVALLGSRRLGILLYGINVLSACLVFLIGRLWNAKREPNAAESISDSRIYCLGAAQITGAITGAVQSMLGICSFVLAFSCVIRLSDLLLTRLPCIIPPLVTSLLFGTLELTSGINAAASLSGSLPFLACAIISGWSGLSVLAQIVSLTGNRPLSFRPYLLAKFASAALNALLAGILLAILT